jgi:Flp pilus assembly protein TadD
MTSLRSALVIPLLLVSACINTPPPSDRAKVNNELCTQELSRGNCKQARVYCELGLEFAPQYADLWSNMGLVSICEGDKKKAKEAFIKAIRFNQAQASAYLNLGKLYLDEGAYGKAHDSFQSALKVNPDYVEARYNLALTYINTNKLELAEKELLTLLVVDPNNAQAHYDLGIVKYRQDLKNEAADEMSKAVTLSPNLNADWWNGLGAVQMELSHFADARQAFATCVSLDNNNAQCLNNLSIAQRKAALNDAGFNEARDTLKAENNPASLFRLARKYKDQGLLSEEERTYKECLKLDGKYPPCHYGLFQLYSDGQKRQAAEVACKNFLKYGVVEEFPTEMETCEKFLSARSY